MKFVLILLTIYLNLFQIIDTKPYRLMLEDKLLPYIDSSIAPLSECFSLDNLIFEQIDDDDVQVGGYLKALKSMDRNLPMVVNIRTQNFEKATWNEAVYRLTWPSACSEFTDPHRPWYNLTKLWIACPSQKGDKWEIESNQLNIIYDVPSTMPIVPWRIYFLISQGIPGFENFKCGYGVELQLLSIN